MSTERGDTVIEGLPARGLDALVVSDVTNVRYLTGYTGDNGIALLSPERRLLLTDSRYALSAGAETWGVEVTLGRRDLLDDLARALSEVAPGGRVGFEAASLTVERHRRLAEAGEGVELVPTTGVVEDLRVRKDPSEAAKIRAAAAMADGALSAVLTEGIVGRSERDVAFALHAALREAGAEAPSFPTIVGAGPNGALPHAVPGDGPIPAGTLVVIDLGAAHEGYCSDMTRTVATGPLPDELRRAVRVCTAAQAAAVAAVRPGLGAADLDAVARAMITAEFPPEAFGHGLGHGVGMQVHERPGLRPEGTETMEPGMVITIEPGIYLAGLGGVRVEDLVLVTEDGYEVLSRSPKEVP